MPAPGVLVNEFPTLEVAAVVAVGVDALAVVGFLALAFLLARFVAHKRRGVPVGVRGGAVVGCDGEFAVAALGK
jgi:hypothetical protein